MEIALGRSMIADNPILTAAPKNRQSIKIAKIWNESMTENHLPEMQSNNRQLAAEILYVEQIIDSIFEQVADNDPDVLESRSDHDEIVKFSHSLVENEFIFGSPSEEVLESVKRRISRQRDRNQVS